MSTKTKSGLIFALLCVLSTSAMARTIVWDKSIIKLDLVVGVEQMVVFPSDGAVGLPAVLNNKAMFRTLFTGGAAYWKALQDFDTQRVKVRLASGEFVLFDISAHGEKHPPADAKRIDVVFPDPKASPAMGGQSRPAGQTPLLERMLGAIRYAAQDVYAPVRLVGDLNGIRTVPTGLSGNLNRLYDQGRHTGLVIVPYKAWSVDGLYVTAFIVSNEHAHSMALDNRKVMHVAQSQRSGVAPHFLASSFFESVVQKRGETGDRTTLFVVTDQPIRTVIRG